MEDLEPSKQYRSASRTEKAVITLSTTLKLIYSGHYSKRPDAALQIHTGTSSSFCLEKVCRALTALHNCPFLPCSFRTLQGA